MHGLEVFLEAGLLDVLGGTQRTLIFLLEMDPSKVPVKVLASFKLLTAKSASELLGGVAMSFLHMPLELGLLLELLRALGAGEQLGGGGTFGG